MRTKHLLRTTVFTLIFIVGSCCEIKAQWVPIPDTAFVAWLNANGFAVCMNGNQMDTTCNAVVNAGSVNINNVAIRDLTGIQYFDNITGLQCRSIGLVNLPALPPAVQFIDALANNLTSLPPLPGSLTYLSCRANQIAALPALPASLIHLDCIDNALTQLPALPASLTGLDCYANSLTSLPALPAGLINLDCAINSITALPALPGSLQILNCQYNQVSDLPALPASLISLNCGFNSLVNLPALPALLTHLQCGGNGIAVLPDLPASLSLLDFYSNQVVHLAAIPRSVTNLNCSNNLLSSLPELPDSLFNLDCRYNANLLCLPQLKRIVNLYFDSLHISCLPNYGNVTNSTPLLSNVSLCGIFNPTGCPSFSNISGKVFYDANTNCISEGGETGYENVKVKLFENGTLKQQAYTGGEGYYSFEAGNGSYAIKTDTFALPFVVSCPANGIHTAVVSTSNQLDYTNDFSLKCAQQGFDVGVASVVRDSGLFRPANYSIIKIAGGDLTNFYGAHCASGVSGQVQMTFSGPATYQGYASDALPPSSVTGNTITWNINDFGTVDYHRAFRIRMRVDTFAQAHQVVDFVVSVLPITGDRNPSNNYLARNIEIIVPYDPNNKEVYPANNIDTSQEWLTYTVNFQNVGTAEAQHIYITDTLDNNLDVSTFQLLGYSFQPLVQLKENAVRFNFPNINLPDSNSNEPLSHGYVQYKIKIKDNKPVGTVINNTAFIYFDFNAPVVTNTTTNTIAVISSVGEVRNQKSEIRIYPNPASNAVTISIDENMLGSTAIITDVTGRKMAAVELQTVNYKLSTENFMNGVYFVTVSHEKGSVTKKLVINK